MGLAESVRAAVDKLDAADVDGAATALAVTYATAIDQGADLDKFGPLLLAVLESLLMTPKARAAAVKGVSTGAGPTSPLDELRARRDRRHGGTETVDPAGT